MPQPRYIARPASPAGTTWEVVAKERTQLIEVVERGLTESVAVSMAQQLNEAYESQIVTKEYLRPEGAEPMKPVEEEEEE